VDTSLLYLKKGSESKTIPAKDLDNVMASVVSKSGEFKSIACATLV